MFRCAAAPQLALAPVWWAALSLQRSPQWRRPWSPQVSLPPRPSSVTPRVKRPHRFQSSGKRRRLHVVGEWQKQPTRPWGAWKGTAGVSCQPRRCAAASVGGGEGSEAPGRSQSRDAAVCGGKPQSSPLVCGPNAKASRKAQGATATEGRRRPAAGRDSCREVPASQMCLPPASLRPRLVWSHVASPRERKPWHVAERSFLRGGCSG